MAAIKYGMIHIEEGKHVFFFENFKRNVMKEGGLPKIFHDHTPFVRIKAASKSKNKDSGYVLTIVEWFRFLFW